TTKRVWQQDKGCEKKEKERAKFVYIGDLTYFCNIKFDVYEKVSSSHAIVHDFDNHYQRSVDIQI
ncbi:hypothetical protein, partial [Segatella buccae]|uniref:hypothetical protein n=1 Tax=Segatella buccae TaxID=28126 RepID=UPI001E579353